MEQHALLVAFSEVAGAVEPGLERSAVSKPSHGVPAHVTLVCPCPGDAEAIGEVLAPVSSFDVEFRELRRFSDTGVLCLAPEPAEPFLRTTAALGERFPDWPPYGGIHDTIVPHLHAASGGLCDLAEADVAPRLPLRGRAREAVLLREVASQRWEPQARFPFRSA